VWRFDSSGALDFWAEISYIQLGGGRPKRRRKKMRITELEKKVLRGIAGSDYWDGHLSARDVWLFSVWTDDVLPKQRSGVVSSLVKKGLVTTDAGVGWGANEKSDEPVIGLTEAGVTQIIELGFAEEFNLWYEGKDEPTEEEIHQEELHESLKVGDLDLDEVKGVNRALKAAYADQCPRCMEPVTHTRLPGSIDFIRCSSPTCNWQKEEKLT
jgi:hypothetical protein